jgi:hypothetical protein
MLCSFERIVVFNEAKIEMLPYDHGKDLVERFNKHSPIIFSSNNPDAKFPTRLRETNATIPVSIVARTKNRVDDAFGDINEFSLECSLMPPPGYYLRLTGTHHLLMRGYSMPHSKIIEPDDGNRPITILLRKEKEVDDLPLPFSMGITVEVCPLHYLRIVRRKTVSGSCAAAGADETTTTTSILNTAAEQHNRSALKTFFD